MKNEKKNKQLTHKLTFNNKFNTDCNCSKAKQKKGSDLNIHVRTK